MNLVVDLGNTKAKLAVFQDGELIDDAHSSEISVEVIRAFIGDRKIQSSILASVINHSQELEGYLAEISHFVHFTHKTTLPIALKYNTPETLGLDRIATAVGANAKFPNQNVLSIDVGTCIKYDFVDAQNNYQGGGISPGIKMRFKALNTFTDKLPLIEQKNIDFLIGKDTEGSILSGVINGAISEIEGMIRTYSVKVPNLQIIVTGGDARIFDKDDKNPIFADSFLTLRGLNTILEHNV